jgi:hypothetical protein
LNNGTLYNGTNVCNGNDCPSWVSDTPAGYGYAIEFDGVNDYVKITNIPINTASGAHTTVAFWMYWEGDSGEMPIGWEQPYDLWLIGGCFGFNTGENNVLGISWDGLANRWVHVVAIFYNGVPSSTTVSLYVDGVKQNIYECRGSTTASRSVTSTLHVSGWAYGTGYYFGGIIDEIVIYNRSLSEEEIRQHYEAKRAKFIEFVESKPDLGKAIKFDGINDYVGISDSPTLDTPYGVTLEAWVKIDSYPPAGWGYAGILAKGNSPRPYSWYITTIGRMHFSQSNCTGNNWGSSSDEVVPLGEWHHIAVTTNTSPTGGCHSYYLDGERIDVDCWDGYTCLYTDDYDPLIGRTYESNRWFNGSIDEVRIINRTLSEEEIKADYLNSKVWIRLKEIKANSNASVIMYYGNEGASDESNGSATFEFFDDFENYSGQDFGTKWTIANYGNYSTPRVTNIGHDSTKSALFISVDTNKSVRLRSMFIPITAGQRYAGRAYFRAKNVIQGPNSWNKLAWHGRWYDSSYNLISSYYPDIGSFAGTFDWEMKERNEASHWTAPANAAYYRIVTFGLSTCTGEGWIDRAIVRKYSSPEPTVTIGQEI